MTRWPTVLIFWPRDAPSPPIVAHRLSDTYQWQVVAFLTPLAGDQMLVIVMFHSPCH